MNDLTHHPAYAHWVAWGIERLQKHANDPLARFEGGYSDREAEVALGEVEGAAGPSEVVFEKGIEK